MSFSDLGESIRRYSIFDSFFFMSKLDRYIPPKFEALFNMALNTNKELMTDHRTLQIFYAFILSKVFYLTEHQSLSHKFYDTMSSFSLLQSNITNILLQ